MDSQITEILGRNRLVDELLRAGLEVALPARDRGIDLIAYLDLGDEKFVARPIQMKAATTRSFSIEKKYEKFQGLLLAHIWHINNPDLTVTYALTYQEAVAVAADMGWTNTDSWNYKGYYTTSRPSQKLLQRLTPHLMSAEKWNALIRRSPAPIC